MFKNENELRSCVIKECKMQGYKLVYPVENYVGNGIPDILVITDKANILIECKLDNYKLNLLQELLFKMNNNNYILRYKHSTATYILNETTEYNNLKDIVTKILETK